MRDFILQMLESIEVGYLPNDWTNDVSESYQITKTSSGYYAFEDSCIVTDCGDVWHYELDADEYVWDDWNDEYINKGGAVRVFTYKYGVGRVRIWTDVNSDNIMYHDGDYYDIDRLDDFDIVYVEGACEYAWRSDVYFWDSDEEYHYNPEPDGDDDDDDEYEEPLWRYDSGMREAYYVDKDKVGEGVQFGIGFEIEKSEMPDFCFNKHDVYEQTGCVLERDGSVPNGFELKTATYNLMSPKTDERLEALKDFCDVEGVQNAGGHIGFSMSGKNDGQLLDLCSGWLPLIFAMYKKRLDNSYCSAKSYNNIKYSSDKMQAIRMRGNYIEFRLIASVKSYKTLLFRLQLFRIMAKNLGKPFSHTLSMAITEGSELNTLLRKDVYSDQRFARLLRDAITMNKQFIGKRITERTLNQIQSKLTNLCA